jgi:lysozyme
MDKIDTDQTQRVDSPDPVESALALIKRHEGFSPFPYQDLKNCISIGYGTNLTRRGITMAEAALLARSDVTQLLDSLAERSWFSVLNTPRQCVVIDIAYAVGMLGLLQFRRMIRALKEGDCRAAADEILRSVFALQDPARAHEDADIMVRGS